MRIRPLQERGNIPLSDGYRVFYSTLESLLGLRDQCVSRYNFVPQKIKLDFEPGG